MIVDLRAEGDSLEIVKTVERENADFIRLSALMPTTMPSQKETICSFTRAIGVLKRGKSKPFLCKGRKIGRVRSLGSGAMPLNILEKHIDWFIEKKLNSARE